MVEEPLFMVLKERMALLSFASKILEHLEAGDLPPKNHVDLAQIQAMGGDVHKILAVLDKKWPSMIPLPHDGVRWSERGGPE